MKPNNPPLIEATKPFDRLGIDFKGPLPSASKNKYLLTIIDEYSRFPFAYACPNMESSTIIKCLTNLFAIFGTAGFTHSDNGPSLISDELRRFLLDHGIGYSNSSKYNPRGNGQVERYNGVIWKSIQLALSSKNLPIEQWEQVIPEVLHSQRTLLCTATNQTPHERIFSYPRRSASGSSVPSWLLKQGKVLVKRHARQSKYEPLCDEVDVVAVNPTHASVRYPSGREDSVSLRDLAPLPISTDTCHNVDTNNISHITDITNRNSPAGTAVTDSSQLKELAAPDVTSLPATSPPLVTEQPRRSQRESRPPDRFQAGMG